MSMYPPPFMSAQALCFNCRQPLGIHDHLIPVQIGGDPCGYSHLECTLKATGTSQEEYELLQPFESLLFEGLIKHD